jgi:hypothetical protein
MSLLFMLFIYVDISPSNCKYIIGSGSNDNLNLGSFIDVVIGKSNANGTIVVGYLMDQLGPPYRIGALSMAIQDWQASGLLPGYKFRYVFANMNLPNTQLSHIESGRLNCQMGAVCKLTTNCCSCETYFMSISFCTAFSSCTQLYIIFSSLQLPQPCDNKTCEKSMQACGYVLATIHRHY